MKLASGPPRAPETSRGPLLREPREIMEVRGLSTDTSYQFAVKAFDEWGTPGPLSNIATGRTLPPPTGSVSPATLSASLLTGEQATATVTLTNTGGGTLDFTTPTPLTGGILSDPQTAAGTGEADQEQAGGEPAIDRFGGPDAFGYRWIDSDEPGGPSFSWIEISGTGTPLPITGNDEMSVPVPLGFDFPFYGRFFSTVKVNTNGFLTFTWPVGPALNEPLPFFFGPDNLIAPLWDDLEPVGVQRIFVQTFPNRMVVEWFRIGQVHGIGSLTFEAILDATGVITFQYEHLEEFWESATVGIQDGTRTIGLQIAYNEPYLHDNLAIAISALPQWLTVTPVSGRLAAGESIPLEVRMDATGLGTGTYPGRVRILTNDPAHSVLPVDVSLSVTGAPDLTVQPASLDFGQVFIGSPKSLTLTTANRGTDVLHVTGISASTPEISATPSSFDVPPGGTRAVTVTWTPSAVGPLTGSVVIRSDDPVDASLTVPIAGAGIPPPVLVANPTSFDESFLSGEIVTRNLSVMNSGGSPLIINATSDQGAAGAGAIAIDPLESPARTGGPDVFGYRWKDSDEPGAAPFDWADISTTGIPVVVRYPQTARPAALWCSSPGSSFGQSQSRSVLVLIDSPLFRGTPKHVEPDRRQDPSSPSPTPQRRDC